MEGEEGEEERRRGGALESRRGESVLDPLEGLPELPRNRHTLPPVRGGCGFDRVYLYMYVLIYL